MTKFKIALKVMEELSHEELALMAAVKIAEYSYMVGTMPPLALVACSATLEMVGEAYYEKATATFERIAERMLEIDKQQVGNN